MKLWAPDRAEDNVLEWHERKKLLDDVWLLTLFVVLLMLGIPWYLRTLGIDLGQVTWGLFAYGIFHVAVDFALRSVRNSLTLLICTGFQQWIGIAFLGLLWHYAGNVQNPLFLLVFILPVIAGTLVLLPWQSYATALISLGTVCLVAWQDVPDLRWNALEIHLFPQWIARLLPEPLGAVPQPFPSLNTTPAYVFTLLASFSTGMLAIVLMSESWNSYLIRLYSRLSASRNALDKAESLSSEVLRASPWPAALVYKDTFQVAEMSESFLQDLLLSHEHVQEQDFFDVVRFSDPDAVKNLVTGNGGEVPFAVYRLGKELRIARTRVHPVRHKDLGLAYVSLEDLTDGYYLKAALNSVDHPLVILSSAQRVLYLNAAAGKIFENLDVGAEATSCLQVTNLPTGWWEMGLHSRREREVHVNSHRYRALCVASRIPGEKEALTILSLQLAGSQS